MTKADMVSLSKTDTSLSNGLRGRHVFSCWFADVKGMVAVEFALLAVPFLIMLIGTVEICMAYASGYLLEGGIVDAGRLVRTGQAQNSGDAEAAFQAALCDRTKSLINCNDIVYEAITVDSFSDADQTEPVFDDDGNMVSQGFDAGQASETILIRASFRYEFKTPLIPVFLPNWNGGDASMRFISTYTIRNEPFTF